MTKFMRLGALVLLVRTGKGRKVDELKLVPWLIQTGVSSWNCWLEGAAYR